MVTGTLLTGYWTFSYNFTDNTYMSFGVNSVNTAPTSVSISSSYLFDQLDIGTYAGSLQTSDPDVRNNFVYTFDTTCG